MNLRLEKCSIRVRVSFDEAAILARDGRLQESLAMPNGAFVLCVSCVTSGQLSLKTGGCYGIEMKVPSAGLGAILRARDGERLDKTELELHALAEIGADTVKISFEVDRFTIAKKSSHMKKAVGP